VIVYQSTTDKNSIFTFCITFSADIFGPNYIMYVTVGLVRSEIVSKKIPFQRCNKFPKSSEPSDQKSNPGQQMHRLSFYQYLIEISNELCTVWIHDETNYLKIMQSIYADTIHVLSTNVFVVAFSVIDPSSFTDIRRCWYSVLKRICPARPIILMGCEADLRVDENASRDLNILDKTPITKEMGEQLARRINAVKYVECPSNIDDMSLEKIFEEIVWTSLRYPIKLNKKGKKRIQRQMPEFNIGVLGCATEMIQCFLFCERLNIFGENINEKRYFYENFDTEFSTSIEIDGEEYDLNLQNFGEIQDSDSIKKFDIQSKGRNINTIIFVVFSVVEPNSYNAITIDLISKVKLKYRYWWYDEPATVILIGSQIHLRNDVSTLNNLSKQKLEPITFQMGGQLASNINAAKYMECTCFNKIEIKKIFESAVFLSLRQNTPINKVKPIARIKKTFRRLFLKKS